MVREGREEKAGEEMSVDVPRVGWLALSKRQGRTGEAEQEGRDEGE